MTTRQTMPTNQPPTDGFQGYDPLGLESVLDGQPAFVCLTERDVGNCGIEGPDPKGTRIE